MSIISGTPAGRLLDSQLTRLLPIWNRRKTDPRIAAWGWTGFGVTLTDHPTIVYFFGSNVTPPPDLFNPVLDPVTGTSPILESQVKFQSISSLRCTAVRGAMAHPGVEIHGCAEDGTVSQAGTLGAFLTASDNSRPRWALSANHVIAFNGDFPDLKVNVPAQTGLVAGPPVAPAIQPQAANPVDAAIVPCAPVPVNPHIPNLPIDTVEPSTSTAAGTPLAKLGFGMPGVAKGALSYFAARLEINFGDGQFPFSQVEFQDQWIVSDGASPFAKPGDSGALVIAQTATSAPFGLLIAVQPGDRTGQRPGFSIVTPFQNVLSELSRLSGVALQLDPATVGPI
jgi:hypothetical protein